jgi:hypothetical protein
MHALREGWSPEVPAVLPGLGGSDAARPLLKNLEEWPDASH